MADLEKTVSILFKGVDEVSGTMDKIGGSLSSMGQSLQSATQPFADMAGAVAKFETTLAALAAGGIVAAVSAAGTFTAGLNEIHTLLKASPEEVAAFDQAIEDYARNSTQSLEDIQAAIYQSLSANVDYKESIQFITEAEKLAVAGQASLKESVDLLTSVMSAYGASWDEANEYADTFFKTVEIGKVTIPELSGSLALVSPIASAAGVSVKEVSAAIAALTAGGMQAGPAAEYLRQAITSIIDPSKESKTIMDSLGISYGAAAIESKGFAGVMKDVYDKTGGNVDVLAKVFGNVQALSVAMTLGRDSSGLYAKALKEIEESAGSVNRAYSIMVDNIDKINTRLINSMKLALVEAGKPLLDDWANIADGLGKIFQGVSFGLKEGAFAEIYSAIESFASEFADYLREVAAVIPEAMNDIDFDGLLQSVRDLGSSLKELFKAVFGDFDLTKPEGMAAAIQKVVDGITLMNQVAKGIVDGLKPFAEQLGKLADEALTADGKTAELTGKIIGMGAGVNSAISAINSLVPAMEIFSGALMLNGVSNIGKMVLQLGALANPGTLAAAALIGTAAAVTALDKDSKEAVNQMYALGGSFEDFNDSIYGVSEPVDTFTEKLNEIPEYKALMFEADIDAAQKKMEGLSEYALEFEAGYSAVLDVDPDPAFRSLGALSNRMADYDGRVYSSDFMIEANERSFNELEGKIQQIVNPDGTVTYVDVSMRPGSVESVNKKLDEIPSEKLLEIKLQGEIDKEIQQIKSGAETAQSAFEWTAKVNIAGIEASAKTMEAMFGSINTGIEATSEQLSKMFAMDTAKMDLSQYMAYMEELRKASELRDKEFKLQEQLIKAQIDILKTKDSLMKAGKGLIKIDSTGLEPALETILWQILQKVQLQANEDSANFLLGI